MKTRITGTIATPVVAGTVGQNNTPMIKFAVTVSTGGGNNPRVANTPTKKSVFGIMVFGKLAETNLAQGMKVEIEGKTEISEFQIDAAKAPMATCIITAERITALQGNVSEFAVAYNALGNLVQDDADVYAPENGGKHVFSQKIAIGKKVGDKEYPSFYRVRFFGERGEKLMEKNLLNKGKVKSVLVDGSLKAEYNKGSDGKQYLNVDINVNDFQIASFASNNNGQQGAPVGTAGNPEIVYEMPDNNIPTIDIDEEEIPF